MMGEQIESVLKSTDPTYLALGYLRYEALRQLNPQEFAELWKRSLHRSHRFDELVDEIAGKMAIETSTTKTLSRKIEVAGHQEAQRNDKEGPMKKNGKAPRTSRTPKRPTVVSMFCGCGGMDLGFHQAGFEILWANDFDADACLTYRRNFEQLTGADHLLEGDVTDESKVACPRHLHDTVDVLLGGFPCQAFSNAGRRRGIDDHRGDLYKQCIRYASELRPKVMVFENVRGLLTIKGERKLLIEEIADAVTSLGYTFCFNLVNASNYGVPQNRLRTIMIAIRNDLGLGTFGFPERVSGLDLTIGGLLKIPRGCANHTDIITLNPQAYQIGAMVPEGGSWKSIPYEKLPTRLKYIADNMRRYRWPNFYRRFHRKEIAGTITAAFKPENAGVWHPTIPRVLTAREIARIQSFPDNFVFHAKTVKSMYKMIGNAVPPKLAFAVANAVARFLSGEAEPSKYRSYFDVKKTGATIKPDEMPMMYAQPSESLDLSSPTACVGASINAVSSSRSCPSGV